MATIIRLEAATGSFQALAAGAAEAPLALVLHGFPDVPSTFAPMLDELAARGFRVVAPWMRGYAPSPVVGPFDLDTLVADVLAIADLLAPGRGFHLVGHDWGAAVAYVACATVPTRITSAVTISVPHPRAFVRAATRTRQALRSWYMAFFQLPGAPHAVAARDFALIDRLWRTWSPGFELPGALRAELHACLRVSWPAPLLYYRAALRRPGPALRRPSGAGGITVPVLYLHGADDGCIGPDAARGAERHFAGPYRAEVLAGAGHFLPAERPREVAAAAAAWMSGNRTSTGG